jgi:hypothetical protein
VLIPNSASKMSLDPYFCQKKKNQFAYNENALSSPNMKMKEVSERKTIIIFVLNISKLVEIYQDQFKLPRNSKICRKKMKKKRTPGQYSGKYNHRFCVVHKSATLKLKVSGWSQEGFWPRVLAVLGLKLGFFGIFWENSILRIDFS